MNKIDLSPHINVLLSKSWVDLDNLAAEHFKRLDNCPGVYVLAYTKRRLDGKIVDPKDIFYVGMSNSLGGVKQRVKQFIMGIEQGRRHSAGERFYSDYAKGRP